MSNVENKESKHVEIKASDSSNAIASSNPLARGLNVTLSIPETIEVRMVDASALADYEIWLFISSILASAVVGFGVAYKQDESKASLLYNGLVFFILFLTSLGFAIYKRYRLRKKAKAIKLRATEVVSQDDV